jgi:phytoene dehydrogenase-like protein
VNFYPKKYSKKKPSLFTLLKRIIKLIKRRKISKKWMKITAFEYARRCKNPLLKRVILHIFIPDTCVLFLLNTLTWMSKKSAGYPLGGSLKFSQSIENRYKQLGGKINYRSKVSKIIVSNHSTSSKAEGITLENGESYYSDDVLSAADGYYTLFKMLEGKFVDPQTDYFYKTQKAFPSYVQVSLGISRTFEKEPPFIVLPIPDHLVIDLDTKYNNICIRIFNFDPSLAPEGKTLLTIMFPTHNYNYWENLRKNSKEVYNFEKERIANEVIEILEKRFGNIKSNVDLVDVSTPSTVIRYTNNWKGSFEGWLLTPNLISTKLSKTLPGLDNFYMAGHWVEPGGGISTALISGRKVAQLICEEKGKPFTNKSNGHP